MYGFFEGEVIRLRFLHNCLEINVNEKPGFDNEKVTVSCQKRNPKKAAASKKKTQDPRQKGCVKKKKAKKAEENRSSRTTKLARLF